MKDKNENKNPLVHIQLLTFLLAFEAESLAACEEVTLDRLAVGLIAGGLARFSSSLRTGG
jgi:hypothetical protein